MEFARERERERESEREKGWGFLNWNRHHPLFRNGYGMLLILIFSFWVFFL